MNTHTRRKAKRYRVNDDPFKVAWEDVFFSGSPSASSADKIFTAVMALLSSTGFTFKLRFRIEFKCCLWTCEGGKWSEKKSHEVEVQFSGFGEGVTYKMIEAEPVRFGKVISEKWFEFEEDAKKTCSEEA